ncbi:MAG TPA: PASTA domain-containing protein [Bacteroidales bacterium]
MKELINFFKNRTVQKHLLLAFAGLFVIFELVFLALRVYTRHGQALSVPDFNGLKLEEVSRLADETRLRFEIIDSVFNPAQAPGTVVAQTPSVKTKVKANRIIFLTINAVIPEKINMPNLLNMPVRQAEAIIQTNGLQVGYIRYVPNIAKDFVLHQYYKNREIAPGAKIIKGSSVDLAVGFGAGSSSVSVPNLKGLTRETAQESLSGNYLSFGAVIYDNSVETHQDTLKAVIWKQRPGYGASITMGESVDVWLTVAESKAKSDSTANKNE